MVLEAGPTGPIGVEVVVADVDVAVTRVAARALTEAGYTVHTANDRIVARSSLEGRRGPVVLVVDWGFCGDEDRSVRCGIPPELKAHVVAMVPGGRPDAVSRAIAAGADDCITKPLAAGELVARVGWSARMLAASPPLHVGVRDALVRASRGANGEVVVCEGESVGRIWFERGQIVWAMLSSQTVSLQSILGDAVALDAGLAREITQEAKQTGRNALEVVIGWGLASREQVTHAARSHLQRVIRAILFLHEPEVVFAPISRKDGWTGPRFSLVELLPPETKKSFPQVRALPVLDQQAASSGCELKRRCGGCNLAAHLIGEELRKSGAEALAVVYGPTGETIARAGEGLDFDVIRAQVQIMGMLAETERPTDVVVSGQKNLHVLAATGCPDAFVALVASKDVGRLGAVKLEVMRFAADIQLDEAGNLLRCERQRRSLTPGPITSRTV